jgi:hypothetical protein
MATNTQAPKKTLLVGSLNAARDGSYQEAVQQLQQDAVLETEMVDRITDMGAS